MASGWRGILDFDYGIVQAPLGPDISGPELAAAVANAGAIGLLRLPDWVPAASSPCSSTSFGICVVSVDQFLTFVTAAGAGSRQRADLEDEEPDVEAVRGGHCAGVPVRGEPEGRPGGEARRAAGVLGGVPERASRRGAPRRRQGLASGARHC